MLIKGDKNMKLKNILTIALLFVVSIVLIGCGEPPKDPTKYQVEYYMTNNGNWDGTTNEYIEEGKLAPALTIAEIATEDDFSDILDDMKYQYETVEWYADEAHTIAFDFTQPITAKVRVYGKLIEKTEYTITYYVGDRLHHTQTVANGEDLVYDGSVPEEAAGRDVFWYYYTPMHNDYTQFLYHGDPATRDWVVYAEFSTR